VLEDAVLDDASQLDATASSWAFYTFSLQLPAMPEDREALRHDFDRLLSDAAAAGYTEATLRERAVLLANCNGRWRDERLRLVE
jgi:hypothetical protein